jgi:FtsZ-binding cell division protein ZapB
MEGLFALRDTLDKDKQKVQATLKTLMLQKLEVEQSINETMQQLSQHASAIRSVERLINEMEKV